MIKKYKIWPIVAVIALLVVIMIGGALGIGLILGRMVVFIGLPVLIIWLLFFRGRKV